MSASGTGRVIPIYDETKSISCTIERGEVSGRLELMERMRMNLVAIERGAHGMLLHFPETDAIADDLERFAVDEKRCCEFWGFAIDRRADELVFRWDAPPAADEIVERLIAYFRGDEPIADIAGLL